MISRITGTLEEVGEGTALVACGPITYELLVPAADIEDLREHGTRTITFFTHHYLEGQGQGASFLPRLVGFRTETDRAFFTLFTTVKGVGNRKALRALALPCGTVAAAIADRDVSTLVGLPEIGKRTAETIVAELHGKIDRFVEVKPTARGPIPTAGAPADAIAMLTQLGEAAADARRLVERVLEIDPSLDAPDALVAAAYRLKARS